MGVSGRRAPSSTENENSSPFSSVTVSVDASAVLASLYENEASMVHCPGESVGQFAFDALDGGGRQVDEAQLEHCVLRVLHLHGEIVPFHVVGRDVESQTVIQPFILGADLEVLQRVRQVVARQQRRRLQWIAAADAEALRIRRVHQMIGVRACIGD